MSPEAVTELFNHYKRGILLDQQMVKGYNHFMKEGKAPGDFTDWWSDRLSDYQKMMKEHQQ
jgi:cephalosporin-C deacetylase-like acetyl esterase